MSWLVLVVSGVPETASATALGRSEYFSRLVPSVVFVVALTLSMNPRPDVGPTWLHGITSTMVADVRSDTTPE